MDSKVDDNHYTRWVALVLIIIVIPIICLRPAAGRSITSYNRGAPVDDDPVDMVVDYLIKYGYMSEVKSANPAEQLKAALQRFQREANITQTGVWDEDTIAMMKRPRCDNYLIQSLDVAPFYLNHWRKRSRRSSVQVNTIKGKTGLILWPFGNITWGVSHKHLSRSNDPNMSYVNTHKLVKRGIDLWQAAIPMYQFVEIPNYDSLDATPAAAGTTQIVPTIRVEFYRGYHGDEIPFDGVGYKLAHAFSPGPRDRSGAIHIDDDEEWHMDTTIINQMNNSDAVESESTPGAPSVDLDKPPSLYTVLLHELGHSLGMDHVFDRRSVMYPWYLDRDATPEVRHSLPAIDLALLQKLYRVREDEPPTTRRNKRKGVIRYNPEEAFKQRLVEMFAEEEARKKEAAAVAARLSYPWLGALKYTLPPFQKDKVNN